MPIINFENPSRINSHAIETSGPRQLTTTTYQQYHPTYFINSAQVNNIKLPPGDYAALGSYQKLSDNLKIWLWFEQKNNPKRYDQDFFPRMDDTKLNKYYLPENRNLIALAAYRVHESMLDTLHVSNCEFVQRLQEGNGYHTLLIHPSLFDNEQGAINKKLLLQFGCTISNRKFYFMPAASPRTGLSWELGHEDQPFFIKMSVQPEGTTNDSYQKSDLSPEGKISVAKIMTLINSTSTMKDSFFYDEYSMELDNSFKQYTNCSYNVLFRKIPADLQYGNAIFIPFFALAMTPTEGEKPLLVHLIEQSGLTLQDFFNEYFYNALLPFIHDNARSKIYPEHLHGQNLLIKLVLNQLGSQKQIVDLEAKLKYRDAADMKIGAGIEDHRLTTLRKQHEQNASLITPGTYLYLAASDFIKRSIVPIIFALHEWQATGWLQKHGIIDHNKLIMPLFNRILLDLETKIDSSNYISAMEAHNTLHEFTSLLNNEQRSNMGTKRERNWQNNIAENFNLLLRKNQARFTLDGTRQNMLLQHLNSFTTDQIKRYQEIDSMQRQSVQQNTALTCPPEVAPTSTVSNPQSILVNCPQQLYTPWRSRSQQTLYNPPLEVSTTPWRTVAFSL